MPNPSTAPTRSRNQPRLLMFKDVRLHNGYILPSIAAIISKIVARSIVLQQQCNIIKTSPAPISWSGDGNPTLCFILSLARILVAAPNHRSTRKIRLDFDRRD